MNSIVLNNKKMVEERICAICQGKIENEQPVTELPCDKKHAFHTVCINEWIVTKKIENAQCPICRHSIFKLNEVAVPHAIVALNQEQEEGKEGQRRQIDCLVWLTNIIKAFVGLCVIIGPVLLIASTKHEELLTFGLIFTGMFDGIFVILCLLYFISKQCRHLRCKCFNNYDCIC